MSNVTVKIRSMYESLPAAEKRVAGYVLRNTPKTPLQSVYEMSKAAKVSVASVSRLARKVGYANFKEFKIELAKEIASPVSAVYEYVTPEDSDNEIVMKIFGGNVQSLEDTLKIISVPDLTRTAQMICRSDLLVFLGIGGSGHIARDSALRFSHLGIHADAYTEPMHLLVRTLKLKSNSVVVGISHSGRSVLTVKGLEFAKSNGAVTVGISNYPASPLKRASNVFFCTSFHENEVRAIAISSRVGQICLLDSLYALVARYKKTLPDPEALNDLVEENFRFPNRSTGKM